MDDNTKLKSTVESIVHSIFSEKEEADRQRIAEEALTKATASIDSLTTALSEQKESFKELEDKYNSAVSSLEEMEAKVAESATSKVELESQVASLTKELEEAKAKLESSTSELDVVSKELAEVKAVIEEAEKTKRAELRYSDLEAASVAYKDKDKQLQKIKEMSDEEFASYKDELISIKDLLSQKESASTPPLADVSKPDGNVTMIVETASEDSVSKYAKLGEALASML